MTTKHAFASLLTASLLLSSTSALADDPENVAAVEPEAPLPRDAEMAPDDVEEPTRDGVRIRAGFNFGAGGVVSPFGGGWALTANARVGAQITHHWGVYYHLHHEVMAASGDGSGAAAFTLGNAVMGSLTLADLFEIGLGPSLDYIGMSSCGGGDTNVSVSAGGVTCGLSWGPRPAAHNRLGFHFGGFDADNFHRSGFSIGLDTHAIFVSGGPLVSVTASLGADWY